MKDIKNKTFNGTDEPGFKNLGEAFRQFNPSSEKKSELDYYFDSYSYMDIHQEMLSDVARTEAYRDSMYLNKDLFKGKIVMDIGCGTGILSMFAAKSGAKHVYAIEMADVYKVAKQIIKLNGYENKITVLNGKIEEIELPVDKVDIIVSEWMGYLLLYEGMFDSVLWARDKYLADDGMLFPDRAVIKMSGLDDHKYNVDRKTMYDNQYTCNLSSMKDYILLEPLLEIVDSESLITNEVVIADIDLMTCNLKELDFKAGFKLKVKQRGFVSGMAIWFDVYFGFGKKQVILSTSPYEEPTHWKQGILYLDTDLPVNKDDFINGNIIFSKNKVNFRDLDVKMNYNLKNQISDVNKEQFYVFK